MPTKLAAPAVTPRSSVPWLTGRPMPIPAASSTVRLMSVAGTMSHCPPSKPGCIVKSTIAGLLGFPCVGQPRFILRLAVALGCGVMGAHRRAYRVGLLGLLGQHVKAGFHVGFGLVLDGFITQHGNNCRLAYFRRGLAGVVAVMHRLGLG